MLIVKAWNIEKSFNQQKILNGLSFEIERGDKVIIKGPNGSGKTTLLRIIAGLVPPDAGIVEIAKGTKISFVFQKPIFLPWLSMKDNLNIVVQNKELMNELIEYFGLTQFLDLYPKELSGGYQQIFSLVRGFIIEHDLLLLDEPFKSLDINMKEKAKDFLKYYIEKYRKTLIMVSHENEREDLNIGNRFIYLYHSSNEKTQANALM
ncbi:MAG: ABC transporter [Dictyoglomus sp. NZ13-RE01]|nr:MAG: ABC transporter [Dictyoglomus sp. NZ13-RE01]